MIDLRLPPNLPPLDYERELNRLLADIQESINRLEGAGGATPTILTAPDFSGQRLTNVGHPNGPHDAVTLEWLQRNTIMRPTPDQPFEIQGNLVVTGGARIGSPAVDNDDLVTKAQAEELAATASVIVVGGTIGLAAPPAVGDANVLGSALLFARENHTHAGVTLTTAQSITGLKTFNVGAGPDFAVSHTVKITNLNADLLDGLDSTAFQGVDVDLTEIAAQANVRGDILITDSGPNWVRLPKGSANQVLHSDGTDTAWATLADADIPNTITLDNITQITTRPHASLTGLTGVDDHTDYMLLIGRGTSQILRGGLLSGDLVLYGNGAGGGSILAGSPIGIGMPPGVAPSGYLHLDGVNNQGALVISAHKPTASPDPSPLIRMMRSVGTTDPPTSADGVIVGSVLGTVLHDGWDGTGYSAALCGGFIETYATEVWTTTAHGCQVAFGHSTKGHLITDPTATRFSLGGLADEAARFRTEAVILANDSVTGATNELRFMEPSGGTEYAAIKAPAISTSYTLTLPVDDGTSSQVLTTDGAGVLSWTTPSAGSVSNPLHATLDGTLYGSGATGKDLILVPNDENDDTGTIWLDGEIDLRPGFPTTCGGGEFALARFAPTGGTITIANNTNLRWITLAGTIDMPTGSPQNGMQGVLYNPTITHAADASTLLYSFNTFANTTSVTSSGATSTPMLQDSFFDGVTITHAGSGHSVNGLNYQGVSLVSVPIYRTAHATGHFDNLLVDAVTVRPQFNITVAGGELTVARRSAVRLWPFGGKDATGTYDLTTDGVVNVTLNCGLYVEDQRTSSATDGLGSFGTLNVATNAAVYSLLGPSTTTGADTTNWLIYGGGAAKSCLGGATRIGDQTIPVSAMLEVTTTTMCPSLFGGINSGDDLTLQSNTSATPGNIFVESGTYTLGAAGVKPAFTFNPTLTMNGALATIIGLEIGSTNLAVNTWNITGAITSGGGIGMIFSPIIQCTSDIVGGTGGGRWSIFQNLATWKANGAGVDLDVEWVRGLDWRPTYTTTGAAADIDVTEDTCVYSEPTIATGGTVTHRRGLFFKTHLGAGAATNTFPIEIQEQTNAGLVVGFYSHITAGSNLKYNIVCDGTAPSIHKGLFRIGDTTAPVICATAAVPLQVANYGWFGTAVQIGAALADANLSTNLQVTGNVACTTGLKVGSIAIPAAGLDLATGQTMHLRMAGYAGDPASPTAGDHWYNLTHKSHRFQETAGTAGLVGQIYCTTADSTEINGGTAGDQNLSLTYIIPADGLTIGKRLRISLAGRYTTVGSGHAVRWKLNFVKSGPTTVTVLDMGAAIALGATVTDAPFWCQWEVVCRSVGSGGTVVGIGSFDANTSGTALADRLSGNAGTKTVDTTAAQTIQPVVAWSGAGADADDKLTVQLLCVEVLD